MRMEHFAKGFFEVPGLQQTHILILIKSTNEHFLKHLMPLEPTVPQYPL